MSIAAYRFVRIEIEGRMYTSDVIITPSAFWIRGRGERAIASPPKTFATLWQPDPTLS